MRLEKYLITEVSTAGTTVLHEVGTAIFVFNPGAKIQTRADFVQEFRKHSISPVNSSLSRVSFENYVDKLPDPFTPKDFATIEDAKKIGNKIRKIFGVPSTILWTGPTDDRSEYGSADIVIFDKSRKAIPISLKKGTGQLKNMGINVFSNIIFKDVFDEKNLTKKMYSSKYMNYWDTLVKIWLNIIRSEGLDAFEKYDRNSKFDNWNSYQKNDVPVADITDIEMDFGDPLPSTKIREIAAKFYAKQYSAFAGNEDWQDARNQVIMTILQDIVQDHEAQIRNNLKTLFKAQLSAGIHPLWLVSNAGKHIMYIPSNDDLDMFADHLLKFDFDDDVSGQGYIFVLKIKKVNDPIMDILINFRWKDGQMNGKPRPASDKKMYISDKKWNDMFNKGNIWERKEITDIIDGWCLL